MTRQFWDARYSASDLVWGIEPNKFVVDEIKGLEPGRALDLACGEGRNAIWLATMGWEVTAVDLSPVAIARAKSLAERAGVSVKFIARDILEFEPGSKCFDLVLIAYLHVPVAERRQILARAASALAPGARLLIVAHDITNLDNGYGGPRDASILPSPDELTAELEGLTIIKAERVGREVATAEGPRTAIDALVLASQSVV